MKNKMKIGILTQPLHDNYGGLLQAYALSQKLKEMGHDPTILNRKSKRHNTLTKVIKRYKRMIFGGNYLPTAKEKSIISKNTLSFRVKFFPNLTEEIRSNKTMVELTNGKFDAYIVGSDQCWRPRYSPNILNYFLDFTKNEKNIKRLAYSASFGTSDWEFTNDQTSVCRGLVTVFNAVSVREDSAVTLCNKYFGIQPTHTLDPTMLWDVEFYNDMVRLESVEEIRDELKFYILDWDERKSSAIKYIESKMNLKSFEVMPRKRLGKHRPKNLLDYQYPSPLKWLKGYQNARFVVADSFHGIVFSILYNVPFIAIGNQRRGMARFTSLLKMFNLEDRLITDLSNENIDKVIYTEIDWKRVNKILESKRKESVDFLKRNLS